MTEILLLLDWLWIFLRASIFPPPLFVFHSKRYVCTGLTDVEKYTPVIES